jgi:hypothetical protein
LGDPFAGKREKGPYIHPPAVLSRRARAQLEAEIQELNRRRNSPETKAAIERDRAETRWVARFKKLAKRAIIEFGWDLNRWVTECCEAWEWEREVHKIRVFKEAVAQSPKHKAHEAERIAEIRWQAHIKKLDHQEKLAKKRQAHRAEGEASG